METGSFVEAFFSDDGQRSMRYTPFYANSGFYYLVASERSEYFAWSIMAAMDAIQVLGKQRVGGVGFYAVFIHRGWVFMHYIYTEDGLYIVWVYTICFTFCMYYIHCYVCMFV